MSPLVSQLEKLLQLVLYTIQLLMRWEIFPRADGLQLIDYKTIKIFVRNIQILYIVKLCIVLYLLFWDTGQM